MKGVVLQPATQWAHPVELPLPQTLDDLWLHPLGGSRGLFPVQYKNVSKFGFKCAFEKPKMVPV